MARMFIESDLNTLEGKNAVLTEAGILIGNGEIITEGKVVEIARESQSFLEKDDVDGFENFLSDENINKVLNSEEQLLLHTEVSGGICAPVKRPIIRWLNTLDSDKYLAKRGPRKTMSDEEAKAYYEKVFKGVEDDDDDFPDYDDISECYGD